MSKFEGIFSRARMKHLVSFPTLIFLCIITTACEPVTPTILMMNRQRPNYKKRKLVGRLLLEPTDSYTHDFDAQPFNPSNQRLVYGAQCFG